MEKRTQKTEKQEVNNSNCHIYIELKKVLLSLRKVETNVVKGNTIYSWLYSSL